MTAQRALRPGLLGPEHVAALRSCVDEAQTWPVGSHVWGQYAEQIRDGDAVCRTENVSACIAWVAELVDGLLREEAAATLGEAASAFKDKINYKQPGGAGFRPHQDRRAYPGVDRVMSILVAVDECTTESGCLWVAEGVDELLDTDDRGVVREDVAASLTWRAAELAPGDAVMLDGFAPHYSEANGGNRSRRVLVASYAPTREAYTRDDYYTARAASMREANERDGRFRISTLADFDGVQIDGPDAATDRCTHRAVRATR